MNIRYHSGRKLPWCLDARPRFRRWFKSKAEAEIERETLEGQRQAAGEAWMALTASERNELIAVYAQVKELGLTLRQLLDAYKAGSLSAEPKLTRTLAEAIRETAEAKETAKRRQDYVDGLENYLKAFALGREATPVNQITVAHIEEWFSRRNEAPATRASNLGRLSALFGLCQRRGYIRENPCKRVERVTVVRKPPVILSPDQASLLLNFVFVRNPDYLPFVVLLLMGCLRPEELELLEWSAIDLERKLVFVSADISKVHQRRIVELDETAVEWLKLGGVLPVSKQNRKRQVRRMRDFFGWKKWPQDLLRHTCASYLLAKHQDAGKVALWLGNSPGVLLRHYRELVTREQVERFWSKQPLALR